MCHQHTSTGYGFFRAAGIFPLLSVLLALGLALLERPVFAATKNWDFGAGTYVWNTAGNWDPDGVPVAGDTIQFYGLGTPVPTGQTLTITNQYGNNTSTSVDFQNGAGFILSGTFGAGNFSYLSNVTVSDAFAYTITRTTGNWAVSNTYGLKANIVTGGSLNYVSAPTGSGNNPYPIEKNGGGTLTIGVSAASAAPNAITLNGGNLVLTVTGAVNTAGVISGSGTELTKAGASTYTLSGTSSNTFSGLVNVTAGSLALNKTAGLNAIAGALGINGGTVSLSASDQISNASNVSISSGAFALGANNDTVGGVLMTGGSITGTGTLTSATNFDLQAGSVAAILGGTVGLNKSTSGLVTLTGANTYSGNTTISGGTLQIGTAGSLGAGSYAGNILNNATLQFSSSAAQTLGGNINGSGALLKDTSTTSTLILSGTNGYLGATTVNAGTLQLGSVGALGNSSGVTTAAGTVFDLAGYSPTNAIPLSITGSGTVNNFINSTGSATYSGNVTLTNDNRIGGAGNLTLSGSLSGAFLLTKVGAGTLTLTGASNGVSQISVNNNGTLQIGDGGTSGTLGAASVDVNLLSATSVLIFNRSDDISVANQILNSGGGTTGSIVKKGAGTLTLSNANSNYQSNTAAATTTIEVGTIKLGATGGATRGPLGSSAGTNRTLVSGTGASLDLNGFTLAMSQNLTLNGTGIGGGGALTNTSNAAADWKGLITLGSASSIVASNGDLTISNTGTITGAGFGLTLGGAGNGTMASILGTTTGTLTKEGGGTWTLSGANTYTGATAVNGGALKLTNAAAPSSASFSVVSGATVEIGANATFGATAFSGAGTVRLNGGSSAVINAITVGGMTTASVLELNYSALHDTINSGNNPLGNFVGTLNVLGPGIGVGQTTIQANVLTGTGPLVTRGGALATLNIVGSATGTYSGSITDNNLSSGWNINKSGSGTQILSGNSNFVRDVNVTGGVLNLQNNNAVNGPSGTVSVSSTGALQLQGGLTVAAKPLTLNGTGVANDGALRNVLNDNTYQGAITLAGPSRINSDSGTLTLNTATPMTGAFGLTFGGAGNIAVSSPIQTSGGSVTKDGSGTLTLTGASTYSGGTTVQSGTLKLANVSGSATGSGTLTVQSGATLGGNGSTSGAVIIQSGGHLAPGNSIGIMGSGPLTISGTYDVELGTPGTSHASPGLSDRTNVTGNLALGGTLNLIDNAGADGNGSVGTGSYQIFTYTGSLSGSFGSIVAPSLHVNVVDEGANGSGGADGVFLDVYRLALASAHTPEPINFGNVLTGSTASQNLSITNTAPNDGFSESLNASIGGATGDATTNFGSFSLLSAGSTNNTSLAAGINTSTAGVKSGTATINLASDGAGTSGFGTTALPSQTVNLSATVYDPATASFTSPGATSILNLDIGTFDKGTGTQSLNFEIYNLLQTLGFTADLDLDSITLIGPDNPNLSTDLTPFGNLAPGASNSFLAYLDTTNFGSFSESYQLQFSSSGFADSQTLTLNLTGAVALVPEPASFAIWSILGVAGIAFVARRRHAVRSPRQPQST